MDVMSKEDQGARWLWWEYCSKCWRCYEKASGIKKRSWFGVKEVQLLARCFEMPAVHPEGTIQWAVVSSVFRIRGTGTFGPGDSGSTFIGEVWGDEFSGREETRTQENSILQQSRKGEDFKKDGGRRGQGQWSGLPSYFWGVGIVQWFS